MPDGVGDVVRFFDTTLRDGEQAPGIALSRAEKVEIAEQLARLGVDVIEAGVSVSSEGERDAVRGIAASVEGAGVAGLARGSQQGGDRWGEARQPAGRVPIPVFLSPVAVH